MESDPESHRFEVTPEPGDEDDFGPGTRRRPSWMRALALGLAAVLVLSTIGTVTLVLLRRSARVNCGGSAVAGLDLVGSTVSEARRTLARAPYRCDGGTTIDVAVADLVDCDRDPPGMIVRQGRLDYDADAKPFVAVEVCGSMVST